jgi:UTP--glucose-1-phosphate uridylyltransferase
VQREQEGYGHAVFQSREFAAGEMVLLCLGDHLFRGKPVSPYRQLAQMAGAGQGRSISAVNRISAGELKGYGTIAGTRRAENPRLIDVSLIVEKPDPALARAQLRVNDLPDGTWLGWFGMHLLAPSIYDVLAEMIRDNVRDGGEIQLTDGLRRLLTKEPIYGYLFEGKRYDAGDKLGFLQATVELALNRPDLGKEFRKYLRSLKL